MKKGAFASLFVTAFLTVTCAHLLPEVLKLTLATIVIVVCAIACLGGYLYRRKMVREGNWPASDKPTT